MESAPPAPAAPTEPAHNRDHAGNTASSGNSLPMDSCLLPALPSLEAPEASPAGARAGEAPFCGTQPRLFPAAAD